MLATECDTYDGNLRESRFRCSARWAEAWA